MKFVKNKAALFALPLALLLACKPTGEKLLLPVIGVKHVVNGDTVYHQIQDFSFTNQFGETVNKGTVKNKIYVANFFFATCQSICPEMSKNMVLVQKAFEKDDSLLILSHSVNPMHDTVEVLKAYAESYGALKNKWHFLTGKKDSIYAIGHKSYLINAQETDQNDEGFIHSELFLLIDTKGRIRGTYDGTNVAEVNRLIDDVRTLKRETRH